MARRSLLLRGEWDMSLAAARVRGDGDAGGIERDATGYPGTWADFLAWFPDETACADYLERLRWPTSRPAATTCGAHCG